MFSPASFRSPLAFLPSFTIFSPLKAISFKASHSKTLIFPLTYKVSPRSLFLLTDLSNCNLADYSLAFAKSPATDPKMCQSSLLARKGTSSSGNRDERNKEDDIIPIPECDINVVKERFRLTLIGRVFHLGGRSIDALIHLLPRPRIWNVEGRVHGLNLGNGRFQFDFDNEEDLLTVLNKRPCHFNLWSFALERWEPFTSEDFPNTIPFWITVTGVPVHFWNDQTFTQIANALGKKLLVYSKKARIQVSIDANKPLQFERRIGFPNGDIGRVSLSYEGLHRYCFTCFLISHDENTCPQLTPAEREIKRKQRIELYAKEQARYPLQGPPSLNLRSSLKRSRSPSNGRHSSPMATSRINDQNREKKRRKSEYSANATHEGRSSDYHLRDHKSSSRQDDRSNRSHKSREVWSRLEIPTRREDTRETRGRSNDRHHYRNAPHHAAPIPRNTSTIEWRPRRNFADTRNRAPANRVSRHAPLEITERSRTTGDSQRTISDARASLESGEISASRNKNAGGTNAETEEERIRRIKGKSIVTDETPLQT